MPKKSAADMVVSEIAENAHNAYMRDMREFCKENVESYRAAQKALEEDFLKGQKKLQFEYGELNEDGTDNKHQSPEQHARYQDARRELKKQSDKDVDAKMHDNPYYKAYCVASEFGLNMRKAQASGNKVDPFAVFDNIKYEGVTDGDKLNMLYLFQDYIEKFMIPRERIPLENDFTPEDQKKANLKANAEVAKYAQEFGWVKLGDNFKFVNDVKVPNGKKLVNEPYIDVLNNAHMAFSTAFKFEDVKGNTSKFLIQSNQKVADFCKKEAERIIKRMLENGEPIPAGDKFKSGDQLYADEAVRYDMEKHHEKTKLSWGRHGSPEFHTMEDAYKTLQDAMKKQAEQPSAEHETAVKESLAAVTAAANKYLGVKNGEIARGKVDSVEVDGRKVAKKQVTRDRMEFAQCLLDTAEKMNERFAEREQIREAANKANGRKMKLSEFEDLDRDENQEIEETESVIGSVEAESEGKRILMSALELEDDMEVPHIDKKHEEKKPQRISLSRDSKEKKAPEMGNQEKKSKISIAFGK